MRRLFIIRKDLHLSPGKLAAMVGHGCELYWFNIFKSCHNGISTTKYDYQEIDPMLIHEDIWFDYITGIYTKTICEARNLNHLMKAVDKAKELGLHEDIGYGFIKDKCLTEIKSENEDGTTTVGLWFKPLKDDMAHEISKNYHLYV